MATVTDSAREAVYQHHIVQHLKTIAELSVKHQTPQVYYMQIKGATTQGGKTLSNGMGMFTGPLDVTSVPGKTRIQLALGGSYAGFEAQLSQIPRGGALVITHIEIDGHTHGGYHGVAVPDRDAK